MKNTEDENKKKNSTQYNLFISEISSLKQQLLTYQEIAIQQKSKINLLEKELDLILSSNTFIQNNLNINEQIDFKIMTSLFEEKINKLNKENQDLANEEYKKFSNEIKKIFDIKDLQIKQLKEENQKLKDQKKEIITKYSLIDKEKNKEKECIHCHEKFIPKFNNHKSCLYHPGKIKYYSCNGCGGDEYYNCCKKCLKCSLGCTLDKHIEK
jgi:hypothetical protein